MYFFFSLIFPQYLFKRRKQTKNITARVGTSSAKSQPTVRPTKKLDPPQSREEDTMLRPHHTGVAVGGDAPATTTRGDGDGSAGKTDYFVELDVFSGTSSLVRLSVLGCGVAASVVVTAIMSWIESSKELFSTGQLGAGQVTAFLACFFFISLFAFYKALALYSTHVNSESLLAASALLTPERSAQLQSAAEFSCIMLFFFFCDRTSVIPREAKHYSGDTFWFLWVLLLAAAFATYTLAKPPRDRSANDDAETQRAGKPADGRTDGRPSQGAATNVPEVFHVKPLGRDQTEEWKGWMQVMFLWYHYFHATDLYNAIRLYIAAYVWMTGFGNFSYYYIKRDFSIGRFCGMQWRLNFMVVCVCAVLGNEYMLYYICMLHTTFTVFIYAGLGIASHLNYTLPGMCGKFLLLFFAGLIIWDIDGVFDYAWKPFTWIVQYHDPYRATRPVLHEWHFRSHLDHYIWLVGMLTAYNHPNFDAWLERIDALPRRLGNLIKLGVGTICVILFALYINFVFLLPKKEYNRLHPYTSLVPITLYILLRNLSQRMRMYHLHLFEWLGKITLETYIAQFHVWMATTGINGSPKKLLRFLPEGYPLLNFFVASVVYFWLSFRIFDATNTLKGAVLPAKAKPFIYKRNAVFLFLGILIVYCYASVLRSFMVRTASK